MAIRNREVRRDELQRRTKKQEAGLEPGTYWHCPDINCLLVGAVLEAFRLACAGLLLAS